MTRTTEEAIAHARTISRAKKAPYAAGLCKRACREAYDVPSDGSPSAAAAWERTDRRVPMEQARRGMLLWWTGGKEDNGHVAIYLGKGLCLSTDWKRKGRFDVANVNELTRKWGLQFEGASEDIDGVTVWESPNPHADQVAEIAQARIEAKPQDPQRAAKWRRIHRLATQLGGQA